MRGSTKSYSAWQLARPVVRRRPSECIEAESRCLVGEAVAWSGWTVPSGTLVLFRSSLGLSWSARMLA
jgi:hypothetical protein